MYKLLGFSYNTNTMQISKAPVQVFEGVHPMYDVFAHQNVGFWNTLMVAYNTTGFISCAGTNFAVRATALRSCGASLVLNCPLPIETAD